MRKEVAIRKHCFDCAGESAREVSLCQVLDCALWEWRTGKHISSRDYKGRMEKTKETCKAEYADMVRDGVDISPFFGGTVDQEWLKSLEGYDEPVYEPGPLPGGVNEKCLGCERECKQGGKAQVLGCPKLTPSLAAETAIVRKNRAEESAQNGAS